MRRVAFDTVLYMLLALGLNVVVGWGGLLDLGYVAFYGIGAYSYALLELGPVRHPPAGDRRDPVVVVIGAIAGFLLGLPSRRLHGDYLAIVTLFFLQLFQTIATNGDSIFGRQRDGRRKRDPHASTRSASSATTSSCSTRASFAVAYYFVALGFFAWSTSRCASSTSRAPGARGGRCARIRSPPR